MVALLVLGAAALVAAGQNRAAAFEQQTFVKKVPEAAGGSSGPLRLELDVHTAGVSVKPVAAGEPVHIEADYDPRLFAFRQGSENVGGVAVMSVELRPSGSTLMALLRAKLGGRLAMLHIALPRDVPLMVDGDMVRTFAAMELGGLSVTSTNLYVEEGGIKVSFVEPLARPMEKLSVSSNRGSLSVVGLGNASPAETRIFQHIGAVDLDLRGAWIRDAEVRVIGGMAGGSLWLPDNARIVGLEDNRGIRADPDPELPQPTLSLSISEHMGRFIVMD